MRTHIRASIPVTLALARAGIETGSPDNGLVFEANQLEDGWPAIRAELFAAFELARQAARAPAPVVFIVNGDDLLGRRGAAQAIVATGLLSAARTAGVELAKTGTPVNTLSVTSETPPEVTARWVANLLAGGTSGELVRLGTSHIGKALP